MNGRSLILPNAAIDVGFYATKVTTGRTKGAVSSAQSINTLIFPSIPVRVDNTSEFKGVSRLNGVVVDVDGRPFFVGDSASSLIGSEGIHRRGADDYCTTPGYTALFKGAIWHIAKHHQVDKTLVLEHLVVGLPLSTIDYHEDYLIGLCSGEHKVPSPMNPDEVLTVQVKEVAVVPQPQGASYNFIHTQVKVAVDIDHLVIVMDMGGGTFDWYVCNGDMQPLYKLCGATNTGMLSCITSICHAINPSFASNPTAQSRVETALRTNAAKFQIGGVEYLMENYWPKVVDHVQGSVEKMISTVGNIKTVDHFVLTGGGATILERTMKQAFNETASRIRIDSDPVYSNVKGFHELSELLTSA